MFAPIKVEDFRALRDHVLVRDMNFGARTTTTGIHLLGDDMRTAGIRPRWAQVYAVGPEQQDIKIGQWVLVTHGRWTRGVTIEDASGELTVRRIDHEDVLLVTDTAPNDDTMSGALLKDAVSRW